MSTKEYSKSDKGERNTGYEFDLLDADRATRDGHGLLEDPMAQLGNYDSRHKAIAMKAIVERRFSGYDYEVRAHETMYREREEPVVCGWCGFETWYSPLVRWTFAVNCDASPFCSTECWARWLYANDPAKLRAFTGGDEP